MNAEIVFNDFAKFVESDDKYYTWGKHGIIEDVLAFLGLPSREFLGANSVVHANNLQTLHDFMISTASDEQLMHIYNIAHSKESVPTVSALADSGNKVFVSMPMNKEKCAFVDEIRNGIESALNNTGNTPYFLDKDIHNDNIYVKMLNEIAACKFLVADLTSQNNGVYYEAGYAKALGKTVIFTCKSSDFPNRHFDIQQVQTVSWNTTDDLADKLSNQIKESGLSL
jgi:hypothetical protein